MRNVSEDFSNYFDVITDGSSYVQDESFKLRYQVYCIEQQFEDASRFEDGRESDEYDSRSVHGIVSHLSSGLTAATVRLVLSDKSNPAHPFPIEKHCRNSSNLAAHFLRGVPRPRLAEISRFSVSRDFKRRVGEAGRVDGIAPDHTQYLKADPYGKRMMPHLILGLFIAVLRLSLKNGVTHWYAVMDVSLLRLLSRFGIRFTPVGDLVEYHGLRQPCVGSLEDALSGIWDRRRDIWHLITSDGTECPVPPRSASNG